MAEAAQRIDTKRPWTYNPKSGLFTCKYCSKESDDPQSIRLHAIKAHSAPKLEQQQTGGAVQQQQQQEAQQVGKQQKQQQHARHRHSFRLLNPRVPTEAQAMNDGFSRVCTACDTLA